MSATKNTPASGRFYCRASWHIQNDLAFKIYDLAWSLSKTTGVFHPSAQNLAEFFRCSERSIYRALDELERTKFFINLDTDGTPVGATKRYQPVSHKDWKKANPGQCAEKETMPWTGEGDPLGQDLSAMTGGRLKLKEFQTKTIRKIMEATDHTGEDVKNYFQKFYKQMEEEKCKSTYIVGRFIQTFRTLCAAPSAPLRGRAKTLAAQAATVKVPQDNPG